MQCSADSHLCEPEYSTCVTVLTAVWRRTGSRLEAVRRLARGEALLAMKRGLPLLLSAPFQQTDL